MFENGNTDRTDCTLHMASLILQTDGLAGQVLDLKLGLNRVGRSPENDFEIEHPTVSSRHCELVLGDREVALRDCDSTNGTFVDGERVRQRKLRTGQIVRLGEVALLVENTEARIAIPRFEVPIPSPPLLLADGSVLCRRHPQARATFQCTHCREMVCDRCVTRIRRRGGRYLTLCPICSHKAEQLGHEKKKRKTFLALLQETVKLPFMRRSRNISSKTAVES